MTQTINQIKLGVVMDAIASIHYKKDSTLAMLWEASDRHYDLYYFEQRDLFLRDGHAFGLARQLKVFRDPDHWYALEAKQPIALSELDILLMRKDPPFDQEYIYSTYILEQAEREGVLIVNRPQGLRDANEKVVATLFPECCPPTLVTRDISLLKAFWHEQGEIVCKPLDGMGGNMIFRLSEDDYNANVIFTTLTHNETRYIMAQKFIPAITAGDKRLLLIDGEVIPHALTRVPQGDDWRGNMALGAKAQVQPLTKRDLWICNTISPYLREKGFYFVCIDVIGDYLTEINVTSPTGIQELDTALKLNVSKILFDTLEQKLKLTSM